MAHMLPLTLNPPIISYQYHAFYLGILFETPGFCDDFYSHYVNIYYRPLNEDGTWDVHGFDFVRSDWFSEKDCFEKTRLCFDGGQMFNYTQQSFCEMIAYMIDHGYYIDGTLNAFYQPNHEAYGKEYNERDFLVYGYTDTGFHAAGYGRRWIYEPYQVSLSDFYQGVQTCRKANWIHFLRVKDGHVFTFQLEALRRELDDYLHSRNTYHQWAGETAFGQEAVPAFLDDLRADYRRYYLSFLRVMMEHKECMYARLQYLLDKGLVHDETVLAAYHPLVKEARAIVMLATKYRLTHEPRLLEEIAARALAMLPPEAAVLERVLRELDKQ